MGETRMSRAGQGDRPDVLGLMLAAGQGLRFDPTGRRDKLMQALPDGRIILHAACMNALRHVDALQVICTPARQAAAALLLQDLPVQVLACPEAGAGMGATLKHGVRDSDPRIGWLVLLGDMPDVEEDIIAAVTGALRAGASIARPAHAGQAGHPVGFSAAWRADLLALDDERGAGALLRREQARIAWVDAPRDGVLRDIDHPGDLGPART